jgi:hypothetical protein
MRFEVPAEGRIRDPGTGSRKRVSLGEHVSGPVFVPHQSQSIPLRSLPIATKILRFRVFRFINTSAYIPTANPLLSRGPATT